jgi:hypothetical protein
MRFTVTLDPDVAKALKKLIVNQTLARGFDAVAAEDIAVQPRRAGAKKI